jgi:hypothetical protein
MSTRRLAMAATATVILFTDPVGDATGGLS